MNINQQINKIFKIIWEIKSVSHSESMLMPNEGISRFSVLPSFWVTYSGYFLDTRFRVLFCKIRDGITNIRQSKRQRVQVHSSMNTTQKASSTFEAFLVEKNNVL